MDKYKSVKQFSLFGIPVWTVRTSPSYESDTVNPAQWLLDYFGGGETDSGIRVNETTALKFSAVY